MNNLPPKRLDVSEKPERNREIYEQYKTGVSAYWLAKTYNLTPPRIYAIINRCKEKEKTKI